MEKINLTELAVVVILGASLVVCALLGQAEASLALCGGLVSVATAKFRG